MASLIARLFWWCFDKAEEVVVEGEQPRGTAAAQAEEPEVAVRSTAAVAVAARSAQAVQTPREAPTSVPTDQTAAATATSADLATPEPSVQAEASAEAQPASAQHRAEFSSPAAEGSAPTGKTCDANEEPTVTTPDIVEAGAAGVEKLQEAAHTLAALDGDPELKNLGFLGENAAAAAPNGVQPSDSAKVDLNVISQAAQAAAKAATQASGPAPADGGKLIGEMSSTSTGEEAKVPKKSSKKKRGKGKGKKGKA